MPDFPPQPASLFHVGHISLRPRIAPGMSCRDRWAIWTPSRWQQLGVAGCVQAQLVLPTEGWLRRGPSCPSPLAALRISRQAPKTGQRQVIKAFCIWLRSRIKSFHFLVAQSVFPAWYIAEKQTVSPVPRKENSSREKDRGGGADIERMATDSLCGWRNEMVERESKTHYRCGWWWFCLWDSSETKVILLFLCPPPRCQSLESCSIFSDFFIFPFSFQALLCRVGENCTDRATGVEHSKFAAPVLIPSLFWEIKFNHIDRHIFLFNDTYWERFFLRLDVVVQNTHPWTQLSNRELSPCHVKLIY